MVGSVDGALVKSSEPAGELGFVWCSRIKVNAVMGAMNFLLPHIQGLKAPPDIVPHRSGGVQLEWHFGDSDLEVLVLSDQQYRISYAKDGAESVEDLLTNDPQVAIDALKEMAISS